MDGWKNYPTQCIYTWLTATEGSYRHYMDLAQRLLEETGGDRDRAQEMLCNQTDTDAGNPLKEAANCYADILGWAIRTADYYDVAGAILEDVPEQGD